MKSGKAFRKIIFMVLAIAVLSLCFSLRQNAHTFKDVEFDTQNVLAHLDELTGQAYLGRQTGTEGNQKSLLYIEEQFKSAGILPAGQDGTYRQPFSVVTPMIDTQPVFTISDDSGAVVTDFSMYEDYNILPIMNGGGIDFLGELLMVSSQIYNIDPAMMQDRIVVIEANRLTMDKVNLVRQNSGAGILCCVDNMQYVKPRLMEETKILSTSGRTDDTLLVGYVSRDAYRFLQDALDESFSEDPGQPVGLIQNVALKADMRFPVVQTANILSRLEGSARDGSVLIISANLDGLGEGTEGKFFPGALRNTSGLAVMLEIARLTAAQKSLPYETIIFAGWNGQQQQLAGVDYYLSHPLFPLSSTTVIHLDSLGEPTREGVKLISDSVHSAILKSKMMNYIADAGLQAVSMGPSYNTVSRFSDNGVPAVMLSDLSDQKQIYADTADTVDSAALENSAQSLLLYLKRDVFRDTKIDYLSKRDWWLIYIFLFGLLINFSIKSLYKNSPNMQLGKKPIEQIYYSVPVMLLRKLYAVLLPALIAVFLLVVLANVNPNTNLVRINNRTTTNLSGYLILKKSILYIKNLPHIEFGSIETANSLLEVTTRVSLNSLLLLGSSLLLSMLLGIAKGIYDSCNARYKSWRTLGTMMMFSVPDVLIVLLGLLSYVYIIRHFPHIKYVLPLQEFLLPLLTLSIVPTVYIARISFITVQDEMKKDYIKNAKAKGYGKLKTYLSELLPPIIFKVIDTMPTIMTMLLSNMIIVEYLFNYHGIVFYLLYFYNRQDTDKFVVLAITLGIIYMLFSLGIRHISRLINPLKKETPS